MEIFLFRAVMQHFEICQFSAVIFLIEMHEILLTTCGSEIFYFPLSSKVSWFRCYASVNFRCSHALPGQLWGICMPFQSWGWSISKFCMAQSSCICQPQGHPRAFGTHKKIMIAAVYFNFVDPL